MKFKSSEKDGKIKWEPLNKAAKTYVEKTKNYMSEELQDAVNALRKKAKYEINKLKDVVESKIQDLLDKSKDKK